jgi:hypothetical protein
MNGNGITGWLKQNGWPIAVAIVSVIVAYTLLSAQVQANTERVEDLTVLVERVIRLEEHDIQTAKDIDEIKVDLKEIKNSLNVHLVD